MGLFELEGSQLRIIPYGLVCDCDWSWAVKKTTWTPMDSMDVFLFPTATPVVPRCDPKHTKHTSV